MRGLSLFELIALAINLPLLLAAVGINVYITFISKRELPKETLEYIKLIHEAENRSEYHAPYPLEKKIVTLDSNPGRPHYAEVEVFLMPLKKKFESSLKNNEVRIYDIILDSVGQMTPQELNSVSGKFYLEEKLKDRINNLFTFPIVTSVYFNSFIVE